VIEGLTSVRAVNPIGTGYVYRARNALFVGDSQYHSPGLEFTADHPPTS